MPRLCEFPVLGRCPVGTIQPELNARERSSRGDSLARWITAAREEQSLSPTRLCDECKARSRREFCSAMLIYPRLSMDDFLVNHWQQNRYGRWADNLPILRYIVLRRCSE